MSTQRTTDSWQAILFDYVRSPLSMAKRVAERELAEVAAEREAFRQFGHRVASIEATTNRSALPPRARTVRYTAGTKRVERLRTAYQETVMAVDHYDDVYGEPLKVHAGAELSLEVATVFNENSDFTTLDKKALSAAVDRATTNRVDFCSQLNTELVSVDHIG